MKSIKKVITLLLSVMFLISAMAVTISAISSDHTSKDVTVKVNGFKVNFPDQQPVIQNDRTLVPVRFVAESLGYAVDWNSEEHTAVIDSGRIIFYIGTNQAIVDGERMLLDVKSVLINNRTMVPLRIIAETLGCTVDWFECNRTVLINSRNLDKTEMSVFERLNQSGLFWNYETGTVEYLVWKNNYATLEEASNPMNFHSWWVERPRERSNLENQKLDCTIVMRTFNAEDLAQVKDMFYTIYPTKVDEAYKIMIKTVCGELWQTFYNENSEWYPLYSAMPVSSGTFGTYYFDDRQVEMYCNSTCTRLTIQVCEEGYENPEIPRILTEDEINFYTAQAKKNYSLDLWGLK